MKREWLGTALRLGRVSNLPTVWTNVMAGAALTGAPLTAKVIIPVGLGVSLAYVAGMYLNDAFDRTWDAQHRPERPIPAGEVSAHTVFTAGFAMLATALVILAACPGRALAPGLALAALIVAYDASHKKISFGPLVMGLCRAAVYVTAARAAAPGWSADVFLGAVALLLYLVVLSTIARRETTDPRLPRLVGQLIAGIALLDGVQLLLLGHILAAWLCLLAFFLTRRWQHHVPGT